MMFQKTREKFRKTKEEFREGVQKRKSFGLSLWRQFRKFTDWKGLEVDREEYTFPEIQKMWGFGTGTGGLRRGLYSTGIMCFIFYAIFIWCVFYFFHSIFTLHNYISAASCVIGMAVGFVTGTVSFWRWSVFRKRKYVPFFRWVRGD